ncbi:nuclear receptor coactivator 5 isoform X2 [Hyperolius riggenbachi]
MFRGYGFVQFKLEEEADAAVKGENGRVYKSYRLDINKAAERRNMNKGRSRSSPTRRGPYGFENFQEPRRGRSPLEPRRDRSPLEPRRDRSPLDPRRDRSPLRSSPRRGSREPHDRDLRPVRDAREARDVRDPRDLRDARDHDARDLKDGHDRDFRSARDIRDPRDARDSREYRDPRDRDIRDARDLRVRDTRDARDSRDPLFERYRDARDPGDPLYRTNSAQDKYRLDDLYRKRDDVYERFREPMDRVPEDRLKREERRREELYKQYFDEIQRRVDSDRAVDCSVVVLNKQSKEYAESVGRKVRDLGMMVDLIFLNTEVSLTQALEDVARGGTPFAIVITQQHQTHRSCTVNILFGTPQEHRNMPLADAMVLIARSHERYKVEARDKEREDIARQAAKLSAEAILRERSSLEEGVRSTHPPGIMTLLGMLADNRYVSAEELDKVILYLQQRKERLLALSGDSLAAQHSRQTVTSGTDSQLSLGQSTLSNNQTHQHSQQLTSAGPGTQTANSQQELQAKILSLFNSGASAAAANPTGSATTASPSQGYGNMSTIQQRSPAQMDTGGLGPSTQRSQPAASQHPAVSQHPNIMAQGGVRAMPPRPGTGLQMPFMYGQSSNRLQAPNNVPGQRPGASSGINFDNPSVQKALDTLIQSGPTLSHLVSQTAGQGVRSGMPQQSSVGSYPRHL